MVLQPSRKGSAGDNLSESGFSGFEDVQDVLLIFIYIFRNCILSESGFSGFEDVQDVLLIFIYIFRNCILSESGCPGFEDVQDVF
jgi:hypothetical protein